MGHPVDVLTGIDAEIRDHAREEDVVPPSQSWYRNGFALEIANSALPVTAEQLITADVDAAKQQHRFASVGTGYDCCPGGDVMSP